MSITGSLLAAVAGLKAQAKAIGIHADNVANVSTAGFKKSAATFSSLVVGPGGTTAHSPGGVRAGNAALIDGQGVLQASTRPLDLSISGNGFFAVNTDGRGTGENLFTRAGQFHEDGQGHLVNADGMYLMGWRLDQSGNILTPNRLDVVSVGTLSGTAVGTTEVSLGVNLDATQASSASTVAAYTGAFAAGGAVDTLAGSTAPQFRRAITVVDSLGTQHNLSLSLEKLSTANSWGFVLHANPSEIAATADIDGAGGSTNGIVGYGVMSFNGDGSLASVTTGGTQPNGAFYTTPTGTPASVDIAWSNGATTSSIAFDFGAPGKKDGFTQLASGYEASFIQPNGSPVGLRTGISIDKDGYVVASFSNGATQRVYQVPVATFADVQALAARNGNAFAQTVASGSQNWRIANTGGAGSISPSTLESSTTDLADEAANAILAGRAYSANAKLVRAADDMLDELMRTKR